jgi:hypothetical protein
MVQPNYNPQESLERVKLMMKYDTSKTLNENKEIIFEQDTTDADVGEIVRELDRFNSDEQKIVDIIKKYKNKSSFQNFLNKYKTISGEDFGSDVARAIKYPGDEKEYMDLMQHLKTFGVNLGQTAGSSGRGTLTFDGLSNTGGQVDNTAARTPAAGVPVATPPELKDVKAFQDWLDVNAKGWATGYKDGIINKGRNGGGYGTFGPRTQKAWATYKDQYLKGDTATKTPKSDTPAAETPAAGTPAAGTPAAGTPAAGTPPKHDDIEQVDAENPIDLLK